MKIPVWATLTGIGLIGAALSLLEPVLQRFERWYNHG